MTKTPLFVSLNKTSSTFTSPKGKEEIVLNLTTTRKALRGFFNPKGNNNCQSDKCQVVKEGIAELAIRVSNPKIKGKYLQFFLADLTGQDSPFIIDRRKASLLITQKLLGIRNGAALAYNSQKLKEQFKSIINRPARVVIIDRLDKNPRFGIVLHPPSKDSATDLLLVTTSNSRETDPDFEMETNNPLWQWQDTNGKGIFLLPK